MRYLTLEPRAETSVLSGHDPLSYDTTQPQRIFFIQAIIIIIFARLLGWGLKKIRQPSVIAEVIGGIILGPTVMGRIPGFSDAIFPKQTLPFLSLVATLGLTLFLFLVGLEVDLRVVKRNALTSSCISLSGIVVPFGLGAALAKGMYERFIDKENVELGHFLLFVGVAFGITAFPVLARILTELKLLETRTGVIVLAAGVGNDVVGWVLLAVAVALSNAGSGIVGLYILLIAAGWSVVLFILIKPAFYWLCRRSGSLSHGPSQLMICVTIILVLASAFITDMIGVHPIFGAFMVGLIVPHEGGFAVALTEKIEDIITVLFLPLYFTLSGLKTNLGTLNSGLVWGYTIAACLIAFASKFIACGGAAYLRGFTVRESSAIGTLMACKGLVELIVLNVGLEAGILNTQIFSMLVVQALVSTFVTTPLTLLFYPERYHKRHDGSDMDSQLGRDLKPDASSVAGSDREKSTPPTLGRQRLLFVLDRFEHLPGLLTLVQLMRPSASFADVSSASSSSEVLRRRVAPRQASHSDESVQDKGSEIAGVAGAEEDDVVTAAHVLRSDEIQGGGAVVARGRQRPSSSPISIDALRLIELTARTSAVMRVAEQEDTQRADPLINVFRTVGHLNNLAVDTKLAVVPTDEFLPTVNASARNADSDLILVPWTLPPALADVRHAGGTAGAQGVFATLSAIANPFESIFGSGAGGDAGTKPASPQYVSFVRSLFQSSPCDVGLVLGRPQEAAGPLLPLGREPHILLAFMGGPDDRVALKLVRRLCSVNHALKATVLRFQRLAPEEAGEAPLPSLPPTVHHNQSVHHQDTIYPTALQGRAGGASALEAHLEDDLALKAAEEDASVAGRLQLRTVPTSRPLRELIRTVDVEQPTVVVLGRGRRQPAMTHRDELRFLLRFGNVDVEDAKAAATAAAAAAATDLGGPAAAAAPAAPNAATAGASTAAASDEASSERTLSSETCRVIGEPATAVTRFARGAGMCTLVIAAGLGSHTRGAGADNA